ncbi:hypothetical protein CPC08DRAFT_764198 [Agrocybe pediades]|nr:hypothetical protein CPC08DRAFT_764198 [Agrocybe pediades]
MEAVMDVMQAGVGIQCVELVDDVFKAGEELEQGILQMGSVEPAFEELDMLG